MRNLLSYALRKCHELQCSWPPGKSDFYLKMCQNWTSSCICWKTLKSPISVMFFHNNDLRLHHLRNDFAIFGWIYQNVNAYPAMNWNDFHRLEYSDYCLHFNCYSYNVSLNDSFSLLWVFYVQLNTFQSPKEQNLSEENHPVSSGRRSVEYTDCTSLQM